MTKMCVRVKIHESYISKIKIDQPAHVTVDAYPDKVLEGMVTAIGVLPDSANRYLNPDLKVYLTTVAICNPQEWLKPGMTAKVEILITNLQNVVYVPAQSVDVWEDRHVCYVRQGNNNCRRTVELGENNDEFVEIRQGLQAGEQVLLQSPIKNDAEDADKPVGESNTATPKKTAYTQHKLQAPRKRGLP